VWRAGGLWASRACQWSEERQERKKRDTHLFALTFTSEGLRSCRDAFDALRNTRPKRQVERPGLSSTVKPGHDFIPAEQTLAAVEELCRNEAKLLMPASS